MFSQYSWWDFAKFCLALAIPYYAYVIWTYYRQDIREWLSNRGQQEPKMAAALEEEDDSSSLYSVSHYEPEAPAPKPDHQSAPVTAPVEQASASSARAYAKQQPEQAPQPVADQDGDLAPAPDLHGTALDPDDHTDAGFGISVPVDTHRPSEQSLSDLLNTAQRLTASQEGVVKPTDPTDLQAARLSEVINQQQDVDEFSDMRFTR